jgi:ADP-ribosylglycohydrolase
MTRLSWVQPEDLLAHEFAAARGEGRPVDDIAARWLAAGGPASAPVSGTSAEPATPELRQLAVRLLDEIAGRPVDPGLAAVEPDGWPAIVASWPAAPSALPGLADPDRVLGAWQGRAAGCLLGKPVEKIPRRGIEEILRSSGRWPLSGYFSARGVAREVLSRWPWNRRSAPNSLAENISGMPEDDDLNYPMLALAVLERTGAAFGTDDMAQAWLDNLPGGRVFTAERVAYRNLLAGLSAPATATVRNPYREWIGAAIRGDLLGWVAAGDPAAAAELAWRDARLSHTRNGIYGEMFTAALCSAALVASDVDAVLAAGRSVVPPGSRLAAAIRLGIDLGRGQHPVDVCLDRIEAAYGRLHWVHVLGNACLVSFALSRSRGEFARGICAVVTGGWDTDSNGATVGSVCGALAGAAGLPAEWIGPLRDSVRSSLPGFDNSSLTGLAGRTIQLTERFATVPAARAGGRCRTGAGTVTEQPR